MRKKRRRRWIERGRTKKLDVMEENDEYVQEVDLDEEVNRDVVTWKHRLLLTGRRSLPVIDVCPSALTLHYRLIA